jgi:Zn-dependent protease
VTRGSSNLNTILVIRLAVYDGIMTDSEVIEEIQALDKRQNHPAANIIALMFSLLIFAAAGVFAWDAYIVVLLLVIIFIHELGHLAAMRMFNYKNVKMLFIPLVGGMASGVPQEHDAFKNAIIALAGPLFGFAGALVSTAFYLITQQKVFLEFATVSLVLNAFNLLPFLPLDGGHYVNDTLFSRYPTAEMIFRGVAVLGLLGLAAAMSSVILMIIAMVILMGMRASFRILAVSGELRNKTDWVDSELDEDKVAMIRAELTVADPLYGSEQFTKYLPNLVNSIWMKTRKRFPDPSRMALLLALYLATLFLLVPLLIGVLFAAQYVVER